MGRLPSDVSRRRPWLGLFIVALVGWAVLVVSAAPGQAEEPATKPTAAQPAAKKKISSLDDELLRDLGEDPIKPIDKQPPTEPPPAKPAVTPLDEDLLRSLNGGEDRAAGDADSQDPLERLKQRMRRAEQLLRARKSDTATQDLQGKIVHDLEELIEQLRQQHQEQSSSSSSGQQKPQQTGKRETVSQPQQQQQQAAGGSKSSSKPARDSSKRIGKADAKNPEPGKIQDLIKDIWGELPARLRQQMMQSSVERFVPKYELQIEEYFKTLSEERRDSGADK